MDIVKICRAIAYYAHAGQFRRDGITPYTVHIEQVVNRLNPHPVSQDWIICVAYLHDTLEDSEITAYELVGDYSVPRQVVDSVIRLTKPKNIDYMNYLELIGLDPIARTVKIADMKCNLEDDPTEKQKIKYKRGLEYFLGKSY